MKDNKSVFANQLAKEIGEKAVDIQDNQVFSVYVKTKTCYTILASKESLNEALELAKKLTIADPQDFRVFEGKTLTLNLAASRLVY